MRHHNHNRKFGRTKNQRVALKKGLMRALFLNGKITTTEAKAKEIRPAVEKIVTRLKVGSIANIRLVSAVLYNDSDLVKMISKDISSKYIDRKGGYTRIMKLPARLSDGSKMAIIEFV